MRFDDIELPENWTVKKMTEIAKWTSGGTPKATEKSFYENGNIPWLIIGDLNDGIVLTSEKKITDLGLKNSSAKMIPKGTLLVAMYGSIGKLGITGIECCSNQAIAFAKELNDVSTKYLFHFMQYIKPDLISKGKGDTQKNISITVLNSLNVIVPPLDEQQRIVTRIEELFSELDQAEATLLKTKAQLEVYRQAVLKEAFGSLTQMQKIKDATSLVTSGSRGWAKFYCELSKDRFVRITDLTRDSISLKNHSIQYLNLPEHVEGIRSKLEPGDILVSITADLGSIALVPNNIGNAYINQHIAVVRLTNKQQSEFVAWYLKSESGHKDLLKNQRGNGKVGLGLEDVRNTLIPLVDDSIAYDIVQGIKMKMTNCEEIKATVAVGLEKVASLRQAILKEAFEGKLV